MGDKDEKDGARFGHSLGGAGTSLVSLPVREHVKEGAHRFLLRFAQPNVSIVNGCAITTRPQCFDSRGSPCQAR